MSSYKDAIKAAVEKHMKTEPAQVETEKPETPPVEPKQEVEDTLEGKEGEEPNTPPVEDQEEKDKKDADLEDVKLTKQVIQEKKRLTAKQMEFAKEREAYKAEKEKFEKERNAWLEEKNKWETNPLQYAADKGYDPRELINKYKKPETEVKPPQEEKEYLSKEEAEKLAEEKAQEVLTKAERAKREKEQLDELVDKQIIPELTNGSYPKLEKVANDMGKEAFLKDLEKGAEIVLKQKIQSGEIDEEDIKTRGAELLPEIIKDTLKSFETLLNKEKEEDKVGKGWLKPKAPAAPPVAAKPEPKVGTGGRGISSGGGHTTPPEGDRPRTRQEIIADAIKKHIK